MDDVKTQGTSDGSITTSHQNRINYMPVEYTLPEHGSHTQYLSRKYTKNGSLHKCQTASKQHTTHTIEYLRLC